MYTSGLIVTLDESSILAESAIRDIVAAGPFTLDESDGSIRAVALETDDSKSAHDWHEWLMGRPGVAGVEVVFVHWDEMEESHA